MEILIIISFRAPKTADCHSMGIAASGHVQAVADQIASEICPVKEPSRFWPARAILCRPEVYKMGIYFSVCEAVMVIRRQLPPKAVAVDCILGFNVAVDVMMAVMADRACAEM